MIRNHSVPRFAALAAIAAGCLAVQLLPAQQPDNTRNNQGDGSKTATTADQQKNNQTDRYLTQQIRKAVIGDKSLSTYAHNVKIVSQNGTVTLKGPVRSEDEKHAVVAKAEAIAGAGKVTDELSVKQNQ
jgi:hyperosmotically inducible periplasmic protein